MPKASDNGLESDDFREVPNEIRVASTLLPRIGTPSLSSHVFQWKQSQSQGSLAGSSGFPSPAPSRQGVDVPESFRSTCPGGFGLRRPHLESQRPMTSAPLAERKSTIQASRTANIIENNFRSSRKALPEAPQSLYIHRRVQGLDLLRSGTTSVAMIEAGKNKDLAESWSRPEPEDDPDAEQKERARLERLVKALRAKQRQEGLEVCAGEDDSSEESDSEDAGQVSSPSSPTSAAVKEADWQTMVEQLLRSYEFFKPLEALSPGLVNRLAKEVIYQEVPAEELIFRQADPPDGCWVILSGRVGVYLFKPSVLMDEEPPTPREEYDAEDYKTLKEEKDRMKQRGALRTQRTAKDLADLLVGNVLEKDTKGSKSKKDGSIEGWAKQDDEEPRYKSIEGFSTWSFQSVLGIEVATLGAGRIFGELALQTNHPRAASIKCLENTAFLRIPYATYQAIVKDIFEGLRLKQECTRILQGCAFFRDIERTQPGLIDKLASRGCTMLFERKEQVLFRQSDPALNCYVVLEGTVDVLIYKPQKKSRGGGLAQKDEKPTPRFQELLDKRTTLTEAAHQWTKTAESKAKNKRFDPWPGAFTRYKTTEGFSTFSKESKYGSRVVQLKPGAVVGELALQTNDARAATIKCATDCRFMVVGKEAFLEVMHEHLQMMKFFEANLPGCRRLEYTTGCHPCVHFQKRVFPENYEFMKEGIVAAEPAVFLMSAGTVDFRRYRYVGDNDAYANRHHPLSPSRLPQLPSASRQSTSSRRNQRLAALKGRTDLVCNLPNNLKELHTRRAVFTATVVDNPELPVVDSIPFSTYIVAETMEAPSVFCTMPFLPLPIPEPFDVRCCSIVEAYHIGGAAVDKLPFQVSKVMREVMFKATARRMHGTGENGLEDLGEFDMTMSMSMSPSMSMGPTMSIPFE